MKGKRYLAKNIVFLTAGQFGTKILSFFLVPLYTSVLTSTEYGTYDLYSATVGLFVTLLTLNISDSTTIFLLDKNNSKEGVVSISLKYYFFSIVIFALAIIANLFFNFFPLFNEYPHFLFFMFAFSGLGNLLLCYARGLDLVKAVSISGVLCSAVIIALNIVFLIFLRLGLKGYYFAVLCGSFVQIVYLCFSIKIFRFIKIKRQDFKLKKEMLSYSCPMMLNSISWWINNVSDRYMVSAFCGLTANGIYSVAYKIPSILTMFQSIFNQAWTLSAVQDFDKDDKSGFFSKMYSLYNAGNVLLCSLLIFSSKMIARVLYSNNFYEAWKYVPFLLVSVLFGSLSGYLGGIFAAVKDSRSFALSTVIGALMNIALNLILIPFHGALGAAAATMASYVCVWAMRLYRAKKIMSFKISLARDFAAYAFLVLQCFCVLLSERFLLQCFAANILILILLCALYRKDFVAAAEFIKRKKVK